MGDGGVRPRCRHAAVRGGGRLEHRHLRVPRRDAAARGALLRRRGERAAAVASAVAAAPLSTSLPAATVAAAAIAAAVTAAALAAATLAAWLPGGDDV